jgi:hypothetical protein
MHIGVQRNELDPFPFPFSPLAPHSQPSSKCSGESAVNVKEL